MYPVPPPGPGVRQGGGVYACVRVFACVCRGLAGVCRAGKLPDHTAPCPLPLCLPRTRYAPRNGPAGFWPPAALCCGAKPCPEPGSVGNPVGPTVP